MQKILYLLFLLYSTFSYAQIDKKLLEGEWYMYNIEMRDGSKPFLLRNINNKNFNVIIDDKGYYLVNNTILFGTKSNLPLKTNFTLVKNILVTSPESSLSIEKLNRDSLVLLQNIKGLEIKDLQKYYYVRKNIFYENEIKKHKKNDTLNATNIIGPKFKLPLNKRFIKELSMGAPLSLKKRNANFKFNGYVLIDIKAKTVDIKLNDFDNQFLNNINGKNKQLLKFTNWDISSVKDFNIIKIPYAFESYYELTNEIESYGEVYNLYSLEFGFISDNSPTLSQLEASNNAFINGLKEYEENKPDKAIEWFDKAYKINPKNLDAYYNSASINFAIGQNNNACKIWEFLKNEGQKIAEKEYYSKCNN